jgi:hypothetical protein
MPIEGVAEVAIEVVGQTVAEGGAEAVHRRFGWKGCLVLFLAVAGLIAFIVYWLA